MGNRKHASAVSPTFAPIRRRPYEVKEPAYGAGAMQRKASDVPTTTTTLGMSAASATR